MGGGGLERELAWRVVQTDQRKVSVCTERVEEARWGFRPSPWLGERRGGDSHNLPGLHSDSLFSEQLLSPQVGLFAYLWPTIDVPSSFKALWTHLRATGSSWNLGAP